MWTPKKITKDGFESQFGINHLGHFALTGLLLPALETTPQSRVVTVSSNGHRFGDDHAGHVAVLMRANWTPWEFKVGLVLGGGAARGLAHIGVIRALLREGVPIDVIVGTSMGAIIGGAFAATGDIDDLEYKVRAVLI